MKNATTATLTYDVLDHLVAWDAGSTNQQWYAYDASGNRVLRRSTTGSGTGITTYAFGLEEQLYGATGINTGNTYYYSLGGRLIGALTGITTLTPQFFLTDALGSVLATFSASAGSAAVLGNQVYGPYGNQRYTQGSMGTAKGYTGQYADATGLDFYNARYYDLIVGRFVSADTVQGNEQGMDPYAYVGGNPETMNDPTGQCPWCIVLLAGVVGGAIGAVVSDWVTGQPVTWQSVAEGAVAGGLIAGAGILIAMFPPVAALLATTAPAEGAIGGLSMISSFLTINAAKLGAGLIGGFGGGAISGAITGGVTNLINHFWPQSDPKQDKINAQATVIAQKQDKINTQATAGTQKDNRISVQATVIAKLQGHATPTPKVSRKTPTSKIGSATPTYTRSYSSRSYSYSYSVYSYSAGSSLYSSLSVYSSTNTYQERRGNIMTF